jgi:hypothetical protein
MREPQRKTREKTLTTENTESTEKHRGDIRRVREGTVARKGAKAQRRREQKSRTSSAGGKRR